MFGLFKKRPKVDVLQDKYNKLLEEAHRLSHTDRKASDAKVSEANEVLKEIDLLMEGEK